MQKTKILARAIGIHIQEKWPRIFSRMVKQIEAMKELRITSIVVLGRQQRTSMDAKAE